MGPARGQLQTPDRLRGSGTARRGHRGQGQGQEGQGEEGQRTDQGRVKRRGGRFGNTEKRFIENNKREIVFEGDAPVEQGSIVRRKGVKQ